MPTNIKSSQGSIALKNAAMKRTTCNFIPCSACKYCGIRHTHTLRHAHTRGGGVGCRTDRKQRTEVSNKQGKATPLSILGPEENNGRRQRAGLNAVRQSSASRKSPPTSAANTTLTQVTRKYDTCLCLWMHPLRKRQRRSRCGVWYIRVCWATFVQLMIPVQAPPLFLACKDTLPNCI